MANPFQDLYKNDLMRKFYSITFFSLFLISCSPKISKTVNPQTDFQAEVTHEVSRDLSSYNTLFVPIGLVETGEELGYFNTVIPLHLIDRIIDVEPGQSVNPHQLADALNTEGIDNQYLVLEQVRTLGQRSSFQWNLTDPVNEELLFSSRMQWDFLSYLQVEDALTNSLKEYLDENSKRIMDPGQEEQVETGMSYGIYTHTDVINFPATGDIQSAIGIGFMGEYRFNKPLALELGFDSSYLINAHHNTTNYTMAFGVPLHFKWYLTDSFNIHAGPRLNYVLDPNKIGANVLVEEDDRKKFNWDLSFGLGYKLNNLGTLKLGFAKGMSDIGEKITSWHPRESVRLKYDTYSLGLEFKF